MHIGNTAHKMLNQQLQEEIPICQRGQALPIQLKRSLINLLPGLNEINKNFHKVSVHPYLRMSKRSDNCRHKVWQECFPLERINEVVSTDDGQWKFAHTTCANKALGHSR